MLDLNGKAQLANSIRKAREKAGMTQEQLAEHINKCTKTIANYESGKSTPTLETFVEIASVLDCSLDELAADFLGKSPYHDDERIIELFSDTTPEESKLILEKIAADVAALKRIN